MPLHGTNFEQLTEVLDVLQLARERLARPSGWAQGCAVNDRGVCACNAVALSTNDRIIGSFVLTVLRDALPGAARYRGIIAYNDEPGRTQDEIVALVDRAIIDVTMQLTMQ